MGSWDYEVKTEKRESNGIRTLWLHPGETRRVLFVSDAPEVRYEHEMYGLAKSHELDACTSLDSAQGECPWCGLPWEKRREHNLRVRTVGYFTIIEIGVVRANGVVEGWRDADGNEHKGQRRLLRAKAGSLKRPGVLDALKRKAMRYGGLAWCVFDVTRGGQQSPSVGDEWELVERLGSAEAVAEYLQREGIDPAGMLDEADYSEAIRYISATRRAELLQSLGVAVDAPAEPDPYATAAVDYDADVPF